MNNIRIRLIAPLCVVFVGSVALLAQADKEALMQRAIALQSGGDFENAAKAYRAVLEQSPFELPALSNLGVVLAKLGHYDEAIAEYEKAQRLAPDDPRVGVNLALAYAKSGRLTRAVQLLSEIHGRYPDTKQVTLLLADSQLQLGNDDEVIALLNPLRAAEPDDQAVAYMLGTSLLHKKQFSEAARMLDPILSNAANSVEGRFLLGIQMFESGDFPNAAKQLASAIALNPDVPQLQSYYGRALLNTGAPDQAVEAFRKELATSPNDYYSNLCLGQILLVRKQYLEARPFLERALLVRPDSTEAKLAEAQLLAGTNQLQNARRLLESAVKGDPGLVAAHEELATVYERLGLTQEATAERKLLQHLRAALPAADPAMKVGEAAPEFSLPALGTDKLVSLESLRSEKPVVLIFGSYSCPNFRDSAGALRALYNHYHEQVSFLLVYIREAHTGETWESVRNMKDGVTMQPAANMSEKKDHAAFCSRSLRLGFPAVVDGMDGRAEKAYSAWPSLAVLVQQDGRIAYATRLTELDFHQDDMDAALQKAVASSTSAKEFKKGQ